jgi:hypothetical protein
MPEGVPGCSHSVARYTAYDHAPLVLALALIAECPGMNPFVLLCFCAFVLFCVEVEVDSGDNGDNRDCRCPPALLGWGDAIPIPLRQAGCLGRAPVV